MMNIIFCEVGRHTLKCMLSLFIDQLHTGCVGEMEGQEAELVRNPQ